jgi:hypothetical protein
VGSFPTRVSRSEGLFVRLLGNLVKGGKVMFNGKYEFYTSILFCDLRCEEIKEEK